MRPIVASSAVGSGSLVSGELKENLWILVGGFTAFFFLNILNSSYSTVMALIKDELSLSYTMSGALMSAYFVGYTLGQIPWGLLADRHGSRIVMTLSILGIASSTVLFGAAGELWQVLVARFLGGLLGAGVFVPGVRLVSGWFSPGARGTALGVLSVGGSVGLISSSFLVPFAAIRLGWRGTMVVAGLLGIASTLLIWFAVRDRAREGGPAGGLSGLAGAVRSRGFWILAALQFVRLGANYSLIAWLPLLLREEYGLGLVAAGAAFSLFNAAGLVSNPIGGIVSDRVGERGILVVSFAALGLCTISFAVGWPGAPMYLLLLALGWLINFVRSPSFAILPRLYGVEMAGRVSGAQNTFASLGALALPFLLGYIRDTTSSYWAGWAILSLLLLTVAALNLFLKALSEPGEET